MDSPLYPCPYTFSYNSVQRSLLICLCVCEVVGSIPHGFVHRAISHSSQCFTTDVTKPVVCAFLCLTCTFRASCCSARLSRAQVPAFSGSSVRDRKKREGVRGTACTGGYKGVRAVRPESVAGGGWF